MTNRRDILKGVIATSIASPLLPAAAHSADYRDPDGVYDKDGNLLYMPCKVCPELQDDLIPAPEYGVICIRAQSLEPFEIFATSEHFDPNWHQCEACTGTYHTNDKLNKFESYGQVGGVLPVQPDVGGYRGLSLILPSNEHATVTIQLMTRTPEGLPIPGKIVRTIQPKFEDKYMRVFV